MSTLKITPVTTKSDQDRFIKFLWKIYEGNPTWVPPLLMDRRKIIDRENHPFYKSADVEFYLAERNGEIVGRIAAILNHRHNREHNENVGFFGFFECINDQQVAGALLDAARRFLKERGAQSMRGPANPSVNDDWGFLIEGFEHPPVIMMPYNPPYYIDLVERYGMTKLKDLYSYYLTQDRVYTEKMQRVYKLMQERHSMEFRTLDMRRFKQEVELVKEIYNRAWARNWGAIPLTEEEIDALATDLKPIVVPELVIFAEVKGKTIGFALSLPDINRALHYNKKGRLLPGLIRLYLHKKKITGVRVFVLGVLPEYQKSGAAGMLFYETAVRAKKLGYRWGEAGWILEDNLPMVRAAEAMDAQLYKKYRLYEIPI